MKFRAIFLFFMVCAVMLLISCDKGRMWETPGVKPHEEPLLLMENETVPFSGGEALVRASNAYNSPIDLNNASQIKGGQTGYKTYCMQCHGRYLDGRGTVGQSFSPLPTDLREARIQEMNAGDLFQIISYSTPNSRHPGLASTIEQTERWQIASYIKSLEPR